MKWYHKVSLFLVAIGLLISDRWLNLNLKGLNASHLIFPFLLLSFYQFNIPKERTFFYLLLSYLALLNIFFVASGFDGFILLTTTAGTALIAIAMLNTRLRTVIISKLPEYVLGLTLLISLAYYLNFWESRLLGGERLTFMYNNENILAHQMSIGLVLALVKSAQVKFKHQNLLWFVISLIFIMPLIATVSRTGIALMLLTLGVFFYARLKVMGTFAIISLFFFAAVIGLLPDVEFLTKSKFINAFFERSTEAVDDPRFQLWQVGWNLAKDHFITGVGYANFLSTEWRNRIGQDSILGFGGFSSVHNSFIDLILIGGIWLLIVYVVLILWSLWKGAKLLRSYIPEVRLKGAAIISLIMGIVFFSMTGQAATEKKTWFIFAICYLWFDEGRLLIKRRSIG
jgi:O-antigen ligase